MAGALEPDPVFTKQQRIAELAKQAPQMGFTSLNHHLDLPWLGEAYHRTRKDAAPGVDGQMADDYVLSLRENLESLLDRAKSGTYRAPPLRRVHIPKGTGNETRPLGIPTLEDKILQRAVVMALEPIYEQDFLNCSYGFRPRRSAHQALAALWQQTMDLGGCWLVEVDIRKFFDTLDHACLRALLRQRVRDGVLRRLIDKWLTAGLLEDGNLSYPEAGTPQGGVISPLLANIFLHEVLDAWFERDIKPRLKGWAVLIRYADDGVLGFSHEEDASRVLAVLPKRFGKYGLTLHPTKTRMIDFRPPRGRGPDAPSDSHRKRTFDLLGFTHYWARSRRGYWVVKQKTATDRFSRAVARIEQWCRTHRHMPVKEQRDALAHKLRGHYGYYGITGNAWMLGRFLYAVTRRWRYWLNRRSQRGKWSWERFARFLRARPLPPPVAIHSLLRHAANP